MNLSLEDYRVAEEKFDIFYQERLGIVKAKNIEYRKPTDIKISTITLTGKIGDYVMGKFLYDRLPINEDLIYIENGKEYKGVKTKKKVKYSKKEKVSKLDKRKLGRGKPLSNQISIGMKGEGYHKNPVCLKIFKNGNIQLTGCKTIEEGIMLYKKLYEYINKISTTFYLEEDDKYYKIESVKNMIKPKDLVLNSEMINASYNFNFEIDQIKLNDLLKSLYKDNEIFVTYDSCVSSPAVRCYLMNMSVYDVRKKKPKQPSVFVYRSGSCNIIVWKMDMLYKAYDFINNLLKENFMTVVSQDLLID